MKQKNCQFSVFSVLRENVSVSFQRRFKLFQFFFSPPDFFCPGRIPGFRETALPAETEEDPGFSFVSIVCRLFDSFRPGRRQPRNSGEMRRRCLFKISFQWKRIVS